MKNKIIKYNGELKHINTEEKAYFLGFMFGDGTIVMGHDKYNNPNYVTKISIKKTDQDLIYNLKKIFPFFNIGEFDFSIYGENSGEQKSIAKQSKELYMDLLSNGVYPRKSYENAYKLKIPTNIDDNLIPHFIRGFFDADGSVYTLSDRKNLIRMDFCSVSKELITSIDKYLRSININAWKIREKPQTGKGTQLCYLLEFIKTSEVMKLINFMYKDYTIGLKRKADKCLNHVVVNKVIDRNMTCSNCNGNQVHKNGNRGKSTRYKCTDCGKGFSLVISTI